MEVCDTVAVYIHFPYCKSRCPYCDFFYAIKPRDFDEKVLIDRYLEELDYFADILAKRQVKSVFFGGGTPSILSAHAVEQVIDKVAQRFKIDDATEISLEANPNTFDRNKFYDFAKAGINRLSLGVQALNEHDLKWLGRTHTLDEARVAMDMAVKTFAKSSIDLIYARPNQIWEDWQKEIDEAVSFGFKHLSLYQLSIEEGTIFSRRHVQPLEDDKAAILYENTVDYLRNKGFERYEVSNFAANKVNESVHNLVYWQGGDYIGLGQRAHGRFVCDGKIYSSVDGKIEGCLSAAERAEELLFMGLRLKEGINDERFFKASGIHVFDFLDMSVINKLAQLNLVCYDAHNIWLTDQGFLVLDKVVESLVN